MVTGGIHIRFATSIYTLVYYGINMATTTIKISVKTKRLLDRMKMFKNESYEDVILDLIEDHLELNPEFKKELEKAAEEVKKGETLPLAKVLEEIEIGD